MSSIRTTSGQSTIAAVGIRDAAGLHSASVVSVRDSSNTLRQVFSASGGGGAKVLSPSFVRGAGYSAGNIAVTTDQATIAGTDGATSIVWQFADSGWTATNPGAPVSEFSMIVGPGGSETTQVTATVTKAGSSYTTNAITATVINTFG